MPADVAQASNFLLTTDYPVDKLVIAGTGTVAQPASTQTSYSFAHGLPFTPLLYGSWSNTSNYAILYGLNSGPISSTPSVSPFDALMKLRADANNLYIVAENYSASAITFYARLYGFEPTTDNEVTTHTGSPYDSFQINTDYNYTKLYLDGYIDKAAGSGSPSTTSVSHNFGADVQAIVWKEDTSTGVITPLTFHDGGDFQVEDVVAYIGTTALTFNFSGFQPALRMHYRLYIDE